MEVKSLIMWFLPAYMEAMNLVGDWNCTVFMYSFDYVSKAGFRDVPVPPGPLPLVPVPFPHPLGLQGPSTATISSSSWASTPTTSKVPSSA